MDNLTDLKKLWLSADTGNLPRTSEMMRVISKYRSSKLMKKAALIASAIFLTAVMVAVVFNYKSVMVSTRVGEALIIAAGIMLVVTNIRSLGRLYRVKDHTNKEFIEYLGQVQRNRINYYKKTQVVGLVLTFTGLLLYIYEGVHKNLVLCIVAYSFIVAYLVVVWFIIRPWAYKRQAKKLEETIKKMESIAKQF